MLFGNVGDISFPTATGVLLRVVTTFLIWATALLVSGCQHSIIQRTDRSVYRAIEDRQRTALGRTSDVHLGDETGEVGDRSRLYSFTPRPVPDELPEAFRFRTNPEVPEGSHAEEPSDPDNGVARPAPVTAEKNLETPPPSDVDITIEADAPPPIAPTGDLELTPSIFRAEDQEQVLVLGLRDVVVQALARARELQSAKEDLYLAALDLSLERHLWTPQWVASVQAEYANYGQVRDFDHAMSAVSNVAVTQRLPFGGEVTARIINSLMRDLGAQVTSGEPGNFILEANFPLFRGAGRVAYESRYQAERNLIYAVRDYEHFRRSFVVEVAAQYFALQQSKAAVSNSYKAYLSRRQDWEKADFIDRMGKSRTIFEAPRAKSSLRQAESSLVSAKEQYASGLDRFKIFIGMPVDSLLDVVDQDADEDSRALDVLLPEVLETLSVEVALRYRLDLLNSADRVDDARRGVLVAKNRILPDLDASGSIVLDTDPNHLSSTSYNTERTTWRGMIELRMDDRKTERNAYRASLINQRRSERELDLFEDTVRADVRRAVRRIAQQDELRRIQQLNVEENELRLNAARAQFDLGRSTNQDVVDAEDDLLAARNQLAAAIAGYRNAILVFRRDTATLRIQDDGRLDAP